MFAASLDPELSAGDVFRRDWDSDRAPAVGPIVIFSHGCDIDKCQTALAADVVEDGLTDKGLLGDIKKDRVWHAYYLHGSQEPGWVNLRTIRPIERSLLQQRLDRRLHSMTETGRLALSMKFFSYLTRQLPPPPAAAPAPATAPAP